MEITHEAVGDETDSSERILVGTWNGIEIAIPKEDVVEIHEESHGTDDIPSHATYRLLWNNERAERISDNGRQGWDAVEEEVGVEADYGFNVDSYEYRDR